MARKQMRTARSNGAALGFVKATTPDISEYPTFPIFVQGPVDVVGLLVARSGVAAATVRAHLAAFGMEALS